MKLWKPRPAAPVAPVTREVFHRSLKLLVGVQAITAIPLIEAVAWGQRNGNLEVQASAIATLIVMQFGIGVWLIRRLDLQGRARDLYPQLSDKRSVWWNFFFICPFLWIPVAAYLALREKTAGQQPPVLFRRPGLIGGLGLGLTTAALLGLSGAGFRSSGAAYWLLNPTTHYIIHVSDEANSTWAARENSPDQDYPSMAGPITVSRAILKMATSVVRLSKESGSRATASNSSEKAIVLVETLVQAIQQWENQPFTTRSFNPLQLLTPTAPLEIALLSAVDFMVTQKFRLTYVEQVMPILSKIRQETSDPQLLTRLNAVESAFQGTVTYRVHVAMTSTPFGKGLRESFRNDSREPASQTE